MQRNRSQIICKSLQERIRSKIRAHPWRNNLRSAKARLFEILILEKAQPGHEMCTDRPSPTTDAYLNYSKRCNLSGTLVIARPARNCLVDGLGTAGRYRSRRLAGICVQFKRPTHGFALLIVLNLLHQLAWSESIGFWKYWSASQAAGTSVRGPRSA